MTDLQALQSRLGFAGCTAAVERYQRRYVDAFAPGARVLDLGCGVGVFLELLRRGGRQGVGVDASEAEIAKARTRGLDVVQDDALAYLARQREAFDGIFCAHLIEHLPPAVAVAMLEAAWSALRPGGRLVLITPDPLDLEVLTERFWLDLTHVRPYPRVLLAALLAALRFEVLESGNDDRSAMPRTLKNLPMRLIHALRLGRHAPRGDTFVIARRPA